MNVRVVKPNMTIQWRGAAYRCVDTPSWFTPSSRVYVKRAYAYPRPWLHVSQYAGATFSMMSKCVLDTDWLPEGF